MSSYPPPSPPGARRDHGSAWAKYPGRPLDCLETRMDVDSVGRDPYDRDSMAAMIPTATATPIAITPTTIPMMLMMPTKRQKDR